MKDENLLEPIKYYESLKDKLTDALIASFNELSEKTNTDQALNEKYVKAYKANAELSKNTKSKSKAQTVVFIILTVVFIIAIVYIVKTNEVVTAFKLTFEKINLILPLSILYLIISILFVKRISSFDSKSGEYEEKADEAYSNALLTMERLSQSFDESVYLRIVEDILPSLKFYPVIPDSFDSYLKKISTLEGKNDNLIDAKEQYYFIVKDDNESALSSLFGTIEGKPFIFSRKLTFKMGERTYSGSRTFPYTEYYYDSEGNRKSRTEHETLYAHHTEPYPEYSIRSDIFYFTPNAPNLSFDRRPFDSGSRDVNSYITKNTRHLKKLEKESIKNGDGSLYLLDREFEALFNVKERNNDVEFRMMYTPYVIKNTKELIKSNIGFGNDFSIYKRGVMNAVTTDKIVYYENDMYPSESYVVDYSFKDTKARFIEGGVTFLRSIYFTLAPLFVVRLNSDGESIEIPPFSSSSDFVKDNYKDEADAESLVYENMSYVTPRYASSNVIAKASYYNTVDGVTIFTIVSYSFSSKTYTDYIYTVGWHTSGDVPVRYEVYSPISEKFYLFSSYIGLPKNIVKSCFSEFSEDKLIYKNGFLGLIVSTLDKGWLNRYKIIKEAIVKNANKEGR